MQKPSFLIISLIVFFSTTVFAEYRVYHMEVYEHPSKVRWNVSTGFSPDKYLKVHGGDDRISVLLKASWMCYGDTSGYKTPCLMPEPILPAFSIGDRVKINLPKHLTHEWKGVIELVLWRADLKSNVYGIRFENKNDLYARYFEFNLMRDNKNTTQESTKNNSSSA